MKAIKSFLAALQLTVVLGTQIHISVDGLELEPSTYISSHDVDTTQLVKIDSSGDEPYGLIIKKSTIPEIQEHVTKDFLAKFPDTITFDEIKSGFWSQKNKQSKWGKYFEVDVKVPSLVSCKPRVSEFSKFYDDEYEDAHVLHCYPRDSDDGKTCLQNFKAPLKQSYEAQEFVAIATVGDGENEVSFKAETTYDWIPSFNNAFDPSMSSWDFTWTSDADPSEGFKFELDAGSSCMPGMMHVELDCSVETRLYWWDTRWSSSHEWLTLEYQTNRHEASQPYANEAHKGGEQYCAADWVLDKFWWDSVYEKDMWHPILSKDAYRGFLYAGNATKLEAARMQKSNTNMPPFREEEMLVHRFEKDKGRRNRIWRCVPARVESQVVNMTIPLKGINGQLQGYLGCIGRDDSVTIPIPEPGDGQDTEDL
ncbi:hypothetical protein ACEPPN_003019 [Leptodophora sp. 'Broadleaf-Isolate-01']